MEVQRVYVGSFMTSLDMAGVSLTLLLLDDLRTCLLDAPTCAPGWPAACALRVPGKLPAPVPVGKDRGVRTADVSSASEGADHSAHVGAPPCTHVHPCGFIKLPRFTQGLPRSPSCPYLLQDLPC